MLRHLLRLRLRQFALVVLVLIASCLPGAKAPRLAPAHTLELDADERDALSHRPFGVVFASPKGPTEDPSEVTILFNRAMRSLDLAGEESARPCLDQAAAEPQTCRPASILMRGVQTAPSGTWRWMGTSALIFAPGGKPDGAGALPRATEFVVTVPAGTKALDGEVLTAPYAFSFTTARPALVRSEPADGATHVSPQEAFTLRFNQPIDVKEIERAARLVVGESASASFHASWPDSANKALITLAPSAPLPLASRVQLVLDASLRGLEGPLPMGQTHAIGGETYGPLRVKEVSCPRERGETACPPASWVSVELSNRVSRKQLRAHVYVDGRPQVAAAAGRDEDGDELTSVYELPNRLGPASRYRVVVSAGMKDEYGQVLAESASFPITTGDYDPRVELGVRGDVFEASKLPADVPFSSVNVRAYERITASLDPGALTEFLTAPTSAYEATPARYARAKRVAGVKVESVQSNVPRNVDFVSGVALGSLVSSSGRGAALLGFSYQDKRGDSHEETHVLSVTDLAITAKMSRFGSMVWVTHLSDGKAVSGATVSVMSRGAGEVFSAPTDASGVATIPEGRYSPVTAHGEPDRASLLVARDGDDFAFRRVADLLDGWRYGVSIDTAGRLAPIGMMFTDRGVYRPGETARVKAIFRRELERGTETPAGQRVKIRALDGNGGAFFEQSETLDAFGEAAVDIAIPRTVHMGSAQLSAQMDGETQSAASASFEVAAYKAAEFKVGVDPSQPSYVRGDTATYVVRGDYLFGAPMSGGHVRTTVVRAPGDFVPPGAESLVLGDDAYASDLTETSPRAGQFQSTSGDLDSHGALSGAVALTMPQQHGAERVTVESEIADLSMQTVAGRATVVVHPAEFYVAMKPQAAFFVASGAKVSVPVEAIEPSGRPRAGVAIHIELVERTWRSVIEASGEIGSHVESRVVDRTVASCDVTSGAELTGCEVSAADAGYYVLRASAKDPRGNPVAASASLYIVGQGGDPGWAASDKTKLDLVMDKPAYEVGDTATILVKSPFREATALVTVERAGIYQESEWVLRGATPTLSIAVTEDMRPNAFVSVHLVRGRTASAHASGPDVGAPAYRLGYAEVRVDPASRRLKVAITPARKDYGPGDQVDADVSVTDRSDDPAHAEVTFYAVDEGVLMLTGYKTPDPIPAFTAPRALSVFALESREDLARVFVSHIAGVGTDKGDEGGGGGSGARSDFRATAYFAPSIVTAKDGKAHVRFKLPDGLTTYRLMAVVAAEDDRFGFGQSQITTSRPLMARPALPRFMRAGDVTLAGVVVSSKGLAGARRVDVELTAQGAHVVGDAKQTITLSEGGSQAVRWTIATPDVGTAKLSFHVRAGEGASAVTDAVDVTREVSAPLSLEAVALYGETSDAAAEKLGDLRAIRGDVGDLDLKVSSTALVGLEDGVEQLIDYPYGCTEQLASRLVPLIPLRALATEYHVALPKNLDGVIDDALGKILANQRSDGSFGYWIDSPEGSVWVTTYALWALDLAKKAGRYMPADSLERAAKYLRATFKSESNGSGLAEYAFIVDVLADMGQPDPAYEGMLYARRAELPLFARALLAHAMAKSPATAPEARELLRDVSDHLRITTAGATVVENVGDRYAVLLDSEARTTAMVIRALAAIEPRGALLPRLARGLLGMRKGGKWSSTQDAAWSLLALDDYRRVAEASVPDFDAIVYLNQEPVYSAPFHERRAVENEKTFAMGEVLRHGQGGETLGFEVRGRGKLFYEARLRYAKKELPTESLDRGFFVKKIIRSVSPDALHDAMTTLPEASTAKATGGDLVLVDLIVVTADPRDQVVIDDPLPAGLEAVDASLATSTQGTAGQVEPEGEGDKGEEGTDDARASGRAVNPSWYHREIKDDRVLTFVEHMAAGVYHYRYLARATTLGRFVVPPTRAECMYDPATFGRTAATTFEVAAGP